MRKAFSKSSSKRDLYLLYLPTRLIEWMIYLLELPYLSICFLALLYLSLRLTVGMICLLDLIRRNWMNRLNIIFMLHLIINKFRTLYRLCMEIRDILVTI